MKGRVAWSRDVAAVLVALALAGLAPRASAQVSITVFGGAAYNFPMPIHLEQDGYPNLDFTGHFRTRPFRPSPYFSWRIAWGDSAREWSVELIHNKFYLRDPTPEVSLFEMTHGFNLLVGARAWTRGGIRWRAGAGIVITYPHAHVRGQVSVGEGRGILGSGYVLSGPAVLGAVGRRLPLGRRFFADVEGRLNAAYAWFPIAGGRGRVPNVAAHLAVGIGGRL